VRRKGCDRLIFRREYGRNKRQTKGEGAQNSCYPESLLPCAA
jgi:hypothetical protein